MECGAAFKVKRTLERHSRQHHAKERRQRAKDWNSKRNDHLKGKINYAHIRGKQCPKCGRRFICDTEFERHMENHKILKQKSCSFCGKLFRTAFNRDCHQRTCSDVRALHDRPRVQQGYGRMDLHEDEKDFKLVNITQPKGDAQEHKLEFSEDNREMFERLETAIDKPLLKILKHSEKRFRPFKFQLLLRTNMFKHIAGHVYGSAAGL